MVRDKLGGFLRLADSTIFDRTGFMPFHPDWTGDPIASMQHFWRPRADFPHRALPEPDINWLHQCNRWFGRYLKQQPTNVENDPPLRLFVTDSFVASGRSEERREGRWIAVTPEAFQTSEADVYGVTD